MRSPTFPIAGTAYYPEAWPESEWRRDLLAIKAAGIRTIRWGEFSWAWWEPEPGVFDFAASDRFVALVGEVGLELILCTPTATPPAWVHGRMPELLMRDQFDRPHLGNRHYGCYHHHAFLALVERIIDRLCARYRDVPHLVGWQIDNETNLGECANGNTYDYHPLAIRGWQQWLERRYGTIERLRQAWTTVFWSRSPATFAEIDPPRPKHSSINHSAWLAWAAYRSESLAGFVHLQRDLLRAKCPGVSVGTNIPDVNPCTMVMLGQDYWRQAEGLDWAGTDLYAFKKDQRFEARFLAYETDLMRSAITAGGARFFLMETQSGPHNVPWRMDFVGGYFDPGYLQRSAATYTAHGAEGVCWFLWRPWATGVECGMNGIVDVDGSPTERSRAMPALIAEVDRAVRAAKPAARRVRLLYSQASLALAAINDPETAPNSAIPGWHAAFDAAGWRCDFVDERSIVGTAWRIDDVLVLPYNPVLSGPEIQAIRRLLAAGGTVVAGWCTGMFDHEGRLSAPRPLGLGEAAGYRHLASDHLTAAHAWRIAVGGADAVLTGNVARVEAAAGTTVALATADGLPVVTRSADGRWIGVHADLGSSLWKDETGADRIARAVLGCIGAV